MSLMGTVTKLAIGFAMAKGMDAVNQGGGLGKMMEGLTGGAAGGDGTNQASGMGGLSDIMGQLGGGGAADGQAGGGLGGMLGQLSGGSQDQAAGGGLGGMLGQLTGGASGGAGGLGDMLGQLTGGAGGAAAAGGLGGLGGLLGGLAGARGGAAAGGLEALLSQDNPVDEPDEDDVAKLMLRAMTQAARADGDIDANEKSNLMEILNDGDPANIAVLQQILDEPVSASALAADTPKGLETQVYTMSVNSISPDNQAEAKYLHELAGGLGIQPATVNEIHDSLGAQRLYS